MTVHELKTVQPYFDAVVNGIKTFELRRNDRGFEVGDTLILKEYDAEKGYSGKEVRKIVTYILHEYHNALNDNYVIMGLTNHSTDEQQMEQEAREMRKLHCNTLLGLTDILTGSAMLKINTEIETALTEFGKMWYERGKLEIINSDVIENYKAACAELGKQLAEKDKEIRNEKLFTVKVQQDLLTNINELTAAKEQIAKLEQQNADMELALKNL